MDIALEVVFRAGEVVSGTVTTVLTVVLAAETALSGAVDSG